MSWRRLELETRAARIEQGLQAQIADPLWTLARQWQLGELRGEDTGSPLQVRLTVRTTPLVVAGNDGTGPPEARAMGEDPADGPAALRLAAGAGLQLCRQLDAHGLHDLRPALLAAFPLDANSTEDRRLRLLARGAPDGRSVLAALADDPALQTALSPTAAQLGALSAILSVWSAWAEARFTTGAPAWSAERQSYTLSATAATPSGTLELACYRHDGSPLRAHSLDVVGLDSATEPGTLTDVVALPSPIRYRGMPAARWWELEDAAVSFARVGSGPGDIARVLLTEFALIGGDDWFLVPLRLPAGVLAQITELQVLDSFGELHTVRSTAELDGSARNWRAFELTGDPSPDAGEAPWLSVSPGLPEAAQRHEVERVELLRDEAANLAWAVEHDVEGPLAQPRSRAGTLLRSSPTASGLPAYRLAGPAAPHWIPLVPEPTGTAGAVRLRRGRMAAWQGHDDAGAQGVLLEPARAFSLDEGELPRVGLTLSRAYHLARWTDGSLHLWCQRSRQEGARSRSPGLSWDTVEDP